MKFRNSPRQIFGGTSSASPRSFSAGRNGDSWNSSLQLSQRGVALVLTLIMLAIITLVVVVFLATARRNRQTTTLRRDQTDSEFAAERGFQRAVGEIMTNILGRLVIIGNNAVPDPSLLAFDFLVSAPLGYYAYATNWSLGSTNTRPFLENEIPVVVNRSGSVDVYLDLDRNHQFTDPRGPAGPYGDPIWIGVLDKPWLPHAAGNRFLSRMAYIILPVGKSLDINTIHNAASSTTGYDFKRNQGFGPWEINLAAFLAELHPDVWWSGLNPYSYGPFPSPIAGGNAFIDARSIVTYRRDAWNRQVSHPLVDTYPYALVQGLQRFPPQSIDAYSDGFGPNGDVLGADIFTPDGDLATDNGRPLGWSGADATNHFFHLQQFFEVTNQAPPLPLRSVTVEFATNLIRAINGYTNGSDRIPADPGLYYRMLAQLSTESGSDYHDRINLNYAALGTNSAEDFIPWDASAELATIFFTNVAERIFLAQSNEFNNLSTNQLPIRSITQIPIYPTNLYSTAIHRILQQAANIFDATRMTNYPSVFRPLFGTVGGDVRTRYIIGYTNDNIVGPNYYRWINENTNGIPMVIGAKKGFPNFNEFTLRSDILVSRKLEVQRSSTAPNTRTTFATNQMYVLGISNYFGAEAWNSYERGGAFRRPVTITVSNYAATSLTNDLGFQANSVQTVAKTTNVPAGTWRGGETLGFILPFDTNAVFLSNAVYRFNGNVMANVSTNAFERGISGYPLPYWIYSISNRLTYLMSETVGGADLIVDFVLLQDTHSVDLFRDLIGVNPYQTIGGVSAFVQQVWNTNRTRGPLGPTVGILQQMDIALGNVTTPNSEWRDFALTATASDRDKDAAISAFRAFCGLGAIGTNVVGTNATLAMQAPFNPAAKLAVLSTWQANDPLVHYHVTDLRLAGAATNHQYLKPSQPATNVAPSSLGRLNDRYSPWSGNPSKSTDPGQFDRMVKDPGVNSSDDWSFPTNKLASIGLLGRIHRGTPWQTVYFKSEAAPVNGVNGWTNQSYDIAQRRNGQVFSRTHPTNDWRLADMFTTAIDERTSRGLMSINQTNIESWSALLSGVVVISNSMKVPLLGQPRQYTELFIEPNGANVVTNTALGRIWKAVHDYQTNAVGPLQSVGDLLQVPELTVESPYLNVEPLAAPQQPQRQFGLDDFAYERIPQQILSLLRVGQSRFVIYAYGQALKPAQIDPATSRPVNYQVTAEYATRTVVRAEGDPRNRVRLVVESFNVLPPD